MLWLCFKFVLNEKGKSRNPLPSILFDSLKKLPKMSHENRPRGSIYLTSLNETLRPFVASPASSASNVTTAALAVTVYPVIVKSAILEATLLALSPADTVIVPTTTSPIKTST